MPRYFEFEVQIAGIAPPIWRRFRMPTTATFWQLHCALQSLFGWAGDHAWRFESVGRKRRWLAVSYAPEEVRPPIEDASVSRLDAHFERRSRVRVACRYIYDFGQYWTHDIKLLATPTDDDTYERRLVAGDRAAPLDECGGIAGYNRLVRFVETGEDIYNQNKDELTAWIRDWHPDVFDLATAKETFDR